MIRITHAKKNNKKTCTLGRYTAVCAPSLTSAIVPVNFTNRQKTKNKPRTPLFRDDSDLADRSPVDSVRHGVRYVQLPGETPTTTATTTTTTKRETTKRQRERIGRARVSGLRGGGGRVGYSFSQKYSPNNVHGQCRWVGPVLRRKGGWGVLDIMHGRLSHMTISPSHQTQ